MSFSRFSGLNRKPIVGLIIAVALVLALCSCHGQKKPPPKPWETEQNVRNPEEVKWTYMPGGLTINLKAVDDLNLFEGFSHNLMLCIYQLSSPAEFKELASNVGGIRKLLECGRFDKAVVNAERRFISPGEETTLTLDRAEGARHVGLVAGYNDFQPGLVTTMYSFPVAEKRGGRWPWSSNVYNPGVLAVDVLLGPGSIQRIGVE